MQMNLPGSVMGACSRAEAAGTVTHSLIEATASALAAPPSRNSRADGGTSAVAISGARTTPRAARVAATLAPRSAMRSPWSAPSRGDCPLVENRTSFMGRCLPTKMYRDYSPFRLGDCPRRIPYTRGGVGGKIGLPHLEGLVEPHREVGVMRRTSVVRCLTLLIVASFALAGPLAPLAHAQPAQPAPPAQPDLFQETLKAQRTSDRAQGFYVAGAVVVNVFLIPGRAITCAAGAAIGAAMLVVTLGSGYRAATAITREGCGGKWVVKGDDLRPETPAPLVVEPMR